MKKAAYLLIGVLLVVPLVMTACGQSASTPIKIGLVNGFTGSVAQQCALSRDGAQLAVDQINAAGGIKGRQVQLLIQDDALDVAKATSIAKQFQDSDKVNIIMGADASTDAEALAKFSDQSKFPVVAGQPAAEDLYQGHPYFFGTFTSNAEFAKATLLYAKALGYTKVGVAYINLAWGIDLNTTIQNYASQYGISVVDSEGIQSGATDVLIQAKKMKDAGAQVILDPDYASGVLALAQARQSLGWNVPVIAIETTFSPALHAADPTLFEGYYVVGFQDNTNPRVTAVYDAYAKKYGKQVQDSNILDGYDFAMVAMTVLKNASNPNDPASVEKALQTLTGYPQVRGKTNQSSSYTSDRHYLITASDLVQSIVHNGQIVPK